MRISAFTAFMILLLVAGVSAQPYPPYPIPDQQEQQEQQQVPQQPALPGAAAEQPPQPEAVVKPGRIALLELRSRSIARAVISDFIKSLADETAKFEGFSVISRDAVFEAMGKGAEKTASACMDNACLGQIAAGQGAELLLTANITKTLSDFRVVLQVSDLRSGSAVDGPKVELAWSGEVSDLAASLGPYLRYLLLGAEPPGREGEASVELPREARVFADGREIGTSPLRVKLSEGQHVLHFEKDGFMPKDAPVFIKAWEVSSVVVELDKVPEGPPSIFEKWWFWTAVGSAAAVAGTGAYFLTRPTKGTVSIEGQVP